MADDGSDPNPVPYPMPGRTDFSADEEKAMRAGNAAANATGDNSDHSNYLVATPKSGGPSTTTKIPMVRIPRSEF